MYVEIKYTYSTMPTQPKRALVNATSGVETLVNARPDTYKGTSICRLKKGSNYNDVMTLFINHILGTVKGVIIGSVRVRSIRYVNIIDLIKEGTHDES